MDETDAVGLLDTARRVTARTRKARRAFWFPLVVFGVVTLGGSPLYGMRLGPSYESVRVGQQVLHVTGPSPWDFVSGPSFEPNLRWVSLYWLVSLVLGYAATVAYYRRRARITGVQSPLRSWLLAGVALFGTLYALAGDVARPLRLVHLVPGANGLPVVVWSRATDLVWLVGSSAAFLAALAYAVLRKRRSGAAAGWAALAIVLGVFALRIESAVAPLLGLPDLLRWILIPINTVFRRGLRPVLTIAIGLFVLARAERSAGLAAFATAFLGIAVMANTYNVENLFFRVGMNVPAPQINAIVPGAVLVLAGIGFRFVQRPAVPR